MVTIKINTDNAAFDDEAGGAKEVAHILRKVAQTLDSAYLFNGIGTIRDTNGNTCGKVVVTGMAKTTYGRSTNYARRR